MHDILLQEKVLIRNAQLAEKNRQLLKERGILSINLMSSPGSGKTSIVEKTLEMLQDRLRIAVIEGDIQTDLDAQRILKYGIPVKQINTGRSCHLDAHMIQHTLPWLLDQDEIDLLIIENVGNMVCPAEYDLGEDIKVAVMSVTEGDDKPLKYPSLFSASQYLIINKTDLLPYTNFNIDRAEKNALKVNRGLKIFRTSCSTGTGLQAWVEELHTLNLDKLNRGKKNRIHLSEMSCGI